MHKHRQKINRKRFFKKSPSRYEESRRICPICQAESLVHGTCKNCEKTSRISKKLANNKTDVKCPSCNSTKHEKKGFRNQKQRYICKDCGRNWTSNGIVKNLVSRKPKMKDTFQRENTLEEITAYIKKQETNNQSLKFWYRNDTEPREMYDYFIDEKYVQVRSDKGYYIKFLIDKIRKI